jgi:hypothetical protein
VQIKALIEQGLTLFNHEAGQPARRFELRDPSQAFSHAGLR